MLQNFGLTAFGAENSHGDFRSEIGGWSIERDGRDRVSAKILLRSFRWAQQPSKSFGEWASLFFGLSAWLCIYKTSMLVKWQQKNYENHVFVRAYPFSWIVLTCIIREATEIVFRGGEIAPMMMKAG
jgi:hypothetical protein